MLHLRLWFRQEPHRSRRRGQPQHEASGRRAPSACVLRSRPRSRCDFLQGEHESSKLESESKWAMELVVWLCAHAVATSGHQTAASTCQSRDSETASLLVSQVELGRALSCFESSGTPDGSAFVVTCDRRSARPKFVLGEQKSSAAWSSRTFRPTVVTTQSSSVHGLVHRCASRRIRFLYYSTVGK